MGNYNVMPSARLVFNRRNKLSQDGSAAIELEVLFRGRRKWMAAGVRVNPREWNGKTCSVWHRQDMSLLNSRLQMLVANANALFLELERRGREFDWSMLDGDALRKKPAGVEDDVVEWLEDRIKERNVRSRTRQNHMVMLSMLRRYNEQARPDMRLGCFCSLSRRIMQALDDYMLQAGLSQNSRVAYWTMFRSYMKEAAEAGLVADVDMLAVKVRREKVEAVRYVDREVLDRLRALDYSHNVCRAQARDLFLFQTMTGMAFVDACGFDESACVVRNGRYMYRAKRVKTGEVFEVVVRAEALDIYRRWSGQDRWGYSYLSSYDRLLRCISEDAGLDVRLSSHMGRHTFAVLALNAGVGIEVLAKMMGHTKIDTTQVYAKVLSKSVEGAFDLMVW